MTAKEQPNGGAFSVVAGLAIVIVGVISFAAFFVLMAFADDLRSPNDGGEHALSRSAVGFAGLVTLLKQNDHRVRISRSPADETVSYGEFTVLTPPASQSVQPDDLYSIWGSNLIILPKWRTRPQDQKPDWVDNDGLLAVHAIEQVVAGLASDITVAQHSAPSGSSLTFTASRETAALGPIPVLQTIAANGLEPIVTDQAGHIVLGGIYDPEEEDGVPYTYILADPDLLNVHGLSSLTTARTGLKVLDLLVTPETPVVFDMTLHGVVRSRNVLQLLFTPPFLPGLLCLVFAGLLIGVTAFAGNRRVRGEREIPLGKLTLVENSAQLISLAGRGAAMGQRYATMIKRQVARALGLPPGSTDEQQTLVLDTVSGNLGTDGVGTFSNLSADIARAKNPAAMVRAMHRLFKWKQELGRERKRR